MLRVWLAISVFFVPGGFSLPLDNKENFPLKNSAFFEGDIKLQPKTRLSYVDKSYYWPDATMFYTIDPIFSLEERDVIQAAIDEIESKTCVRIKPRTNENNYVKIVSVADEGCWSTMGMVGAAQDLGLEKGYCFSPKWGKRHAIHELLHALGFFHEHSAHDRDEYITLIEDNIKKEYLVQVEKIPIEKASNFGFGYDYASVMHYGSNVISIDRNKPSIVPKNDPTIPIGQGLGLSKGDVDKINHVYGC